MAGGPVLVAGLFEFEWDLLHPGPIARDGFRGQLPFLLRNTDDRVGVRRGVGCC